MKIFLKILITAAIFMGLNDRAMGAFCAAVQCTTDIELLGCSQRLCYGNGSDVSCIACKAGYTLREMGTKETATGCKFTYQICERSTPCTGCINCTSDLIWSNHATGYQKKVTRTCNCNTCNTSTAYRCAAGYYGTTTNGNSGCTKCPEPGTSAAGATVLANCFIPAGVDINVPNGTFHYTSACYY